MARTFGPRGRRLVVMAEDEHRPRVLLTSPDVRGLLASVLAVVEREAVRRSIEVSRPSAGQPPQSGR